MWDCLLKKDYTVSTSGLVDVVTLPKKVQWLTEDSSTLFVRQCDKDLFAILEELSKSLDHEPGSGGRGMIVTGNPGIGKTWFQSYCLLRLSQLCPKPPPIFFETVFDDNSCLFLPDGTVQVIDLKTNSPRPHAYLSLPTSFYLFDTGGKDAHEARHVSAFTIVTASPSPRHFKQFSARICNKKFYMPVWTWDEVNSVCPVLKRDETTVAKRFEKYGGIPRYLFCEEDEWDESLKDAIRKGSYDYILKSGGSLELLDDETSHRLIHIKVDSSNYRRPIIDRASNYIQQKLLDKGTTTDAMLFSAKVHAKKCRSEGF